MNRVGDAFRRVRRGRVKQFRTPVGPLEFPESDQRVLRDLFIELKGKGVLSASFDHELEQLVMDSVAYIRTLLTSALKQLSGKDASTTIEGLRRGCMQFMNTTPPPVGYSPLRPVYRQALLELRHTFRRHLQQLGEQRRFREAGELAQSIPETVADLPRGADESASKYIEPPPSPPGLPRGPDEA